MSLELFAHPFSSYCQKALTALYENATPFTFRMIAEEEPDTLAEWTRLWPVQRFPILKEGDETILEATIIIEYLQLNHPGPAKLIPADPRAALRTRMLDRVFDNYVMTPMQRIVFDSIRSEPERDARGVADARAMLDKSYAWLDGVVGKSEWAAGDAFSLADCAAAPSLFYADWVHPISADFRHLRAYRARLLARPSFARAVDEARPYRKLFPLGAPDRD